MFSPSSTLAKYKPADEYGMDDGIDLKVKIEIPSKHSHFIWIYCKGLTDIHEASKSPW